MNAKRAMETAAMYVRVSDDYKQILEAIKVAVQAGQCYVRVPYFWLTDLVERVLIKEGYRITLWGPSWSDEQRKHLINTIEW